MRPSNKVWLMRCEHSEPDSKTANFQDSPRRPSRSSATPKTAMPRLPNAHTKQTLYTAGESLLHTSELWPSTMIGRSSGSFSGIVIWLVRPSCQSELPLTWLDAYRPPRSPEPEANLQPTLRRKSRFLPAIGAIPRQFFEKPIPIRAPSFCSNPRYSTHDPPHVPLFPAPSPLQSEPTAKFVAGGRGGEVPRTGLTIYIPDDSVGQGNITHNYLKYLASCLELRSTPRLAGGRRRRPILATHGQQKDMDMD